MSRDHNQWLTFTGTNLKTQKPFQARPELDSQPDVEGYDTLELKDVGGRYSKPQRLGEQIIGRWEITERTLSQHWESKFKKRLTPLFSLFKVRRRLLRKSCSRGHYA